MVACLLSGVALGVYWSVVGWHVGRTRVRIPTCRDGLKLKTAQQLRNGQKTGPQEAPRVRVIVPAHNEEACIGTLVASLLKQDYPADRLRITLCLDRCTDGTKAKALEAATEEGARDPRVGILEIAYCPEDWAGKVHAIVRGVESEAADGEDLLLFLDADTALAPECIRASVALLIERKLGFLSLMSTLTNDRWFERVLQPAAGLELMRQYPIERANAATHRRAFANGQFMLCTREAYGLMGTENGQTVTAHKRVKDAVLEDIELARLAERKGIAAGVFLAQEMVICRMYENAEQFNTGWKRIYIESTNRRVKRLRTIAWRVRALGVGLPAMCVFGIILSSTYSLNDPLATWTNVVCAYGLVSFYGVLMLAYVLGNMRAIDAIMYGVGAWNVGTIMLEARRDLLNKVPTRWGGRTYVREAR